MIISNQKKVIVSPTDTTKYRLQVETVGGQIAYNDILVQVLKVINASFNYATGNLEDDKASVLLTQEEALANSWEHTGSVIVTHEDYIGEHSYQTAKTLTCNGGLKFTTEVHIPKNSNTVIAGISFDNAIKFEINTYNVVLYNSVIPMVVDSSIDHFLKIELSAIFDPQSELWKCYAYVYDKRTKVVLYEGTQTLDYGDFDTELGMYFADNALATFYYGTNLNPKAIIKANHIAVFKGDYIILDGTDSYDPDLEDVEYLWQNSETTPTIKVYPTSTTSYGLTVSDIAGGTDSTSVTRTNCWLEKIGEITYKLGAVLEDVKYNYTYRWYDSDHEYGDDWTLEVEPPCDTVYYCDIVDKVTNETDTLTFTVSAPRRILHAKDPITKVIQEILVYPSTKYLNGKYIECKVDGINGYIAYDIATHKNASILRCKMPGDSTVYRILIKV